MLQQKKHPLRGFFPTGKSAEPFYQTLIQKTDFWKNQFQVLQIDEFIGGDRFFYRALQKSILEPLQLTEHAETIRSDWTEAEFQQHLTKVISSPIDFALLGLGPNGHIGFHEPSLNQTNFLGGKVNLSDESFRRVSGAPSRSAYTFGASSFLMAERIILIASGAQKKAIFEQFLANPESASLPASLLKKHPNFTVLSTIV